MTVNAPAFSWNGPLEGAELGMGRKGCYRARITLVAEGISEDLLK